MPDTGNPDARIMEMVQKFIDEANRMQQEGTPGALVNAALMLASGTFSTFLAAGNDGYLEERGIRKVTDSYRHNLTLIQKIKKAQLNPDGKQ